MEYKKSGDRLIMEDVHFDRRNHLVLFARAELKENKGRFPLLPIYAIAYGVWRFCIEFARLDERGQTIIPALSPSQLIAILMIIAGCIYLCVWFIQTKKAAKAVGHIEESEV